MHMHVLVAWDGACTDTGTCSVTMTGNRAASATFLAGAPDVTVSPDAHRLRQQRGREQERQACDGAE
jgi:hypothetical protein